MNTRILLAALAGAVATYISGGLIYCVLMKDFYEHNTLDAAHALMRGDSLLFWAVFLGCLAWSFLLALIYSRLAGIDTFKKGAAVGTWIGFLVALGANFFYYSWMNIITINGAVLDAVVNAVQGAIAGGVVGLVLGSGKSRQAR